jgi:hypothetical protein
MDINSEFNLLVKQWEDETGDTSSLTKIINAPSYQKIIGMGKDVILLILKQIIAEGNDPHPWGWALSTITGENPVSKKANGNTVRIARAWIKWGYRNGYF